MAAVPLIAETGLHQGFDLYDLDQDPDEEVNLVPDQTEKYRSLVAALPDESTLQADRGAVSAEVERRLEALSRFVEVAPPAGYEKEIQVARQTLDKIAG